MDLHTEQRHVTQICKECKQEMSYIALKKHLEDGLCSSKPVNCELCNEIVKFSDLEAHFQKCGERYSLINFVFLFKEPMHVKIVI